MLHCFEKISQWSITLAKYVQWGLNLLLKSIFGVIFLSNFMPQSLRVKSQGVSCFDEECLIITLFAVMAALSNEAIWNKAREGGNMKGEGCLCTTTQPREQISSGIINESTCAGAQQNKVYSVHIHITLYRSSGLCNIHPQSPNL